ncbi:hypothetical protein HDU97_004592 [Phlyctochytrium planicorne]|nr:hypothetical protein HDU97_004592 [Phlyctochytrium planicorne]
MAKISSSDSLKALLDEHSFRFKFHDHPASGSAKEWVETVKANGPSGITDFALTKTLILKPKGAAVPIVVIALEDSEFSIGNLGKHLGAKEARAASDDLVLELLKVPKIDVSPFALVNVADKESVSVVVDSRLFAKPTTHLGFRAFSGTKTVFVSAANVQSLLQGEGFEFKTVDFSNLSTAPAAAPAKAAKTSASSKPKSGGAEESSKEVKIGLEVKKSEDFPLWYQQVLTRTEMMDYYDVSGCYIIRPWAFKIWKEIQEFFGKAIEESGVEDCYFPMFVSRRALEREKDHIEGFAPEVAWVTKAGESDLAEPVAVRPTSETVMYPAYAKWVQSHRDLPIRLNQWCNVVRWEFKNPQPFLRTREFLWQEGHTAFATQEEAAAEVLEILDLYRRVYEELLAIPVVPGKKSENEKFAGGLYTTTVEGFVPATGRGIQGATSHCLGQNFAKMFKIVIEAEDGEKQYIWQNSWGLSTRTIGVLVMVHGDDKGLVLPPRVASVQAVVVPTGITTKTTQEEREKINKYAEDLVATLKAAGIRAKGDFRDNYTPGYKFNHWELRGVPIRLEVGPKDMAKNETRSVIRLTGASSQLSLKDIGKTVNELLVNIQADMFNKAKAERDSHLIRLETFDNFVKTLDGKNLILAPWCERVECEKDVKERSGRIAQGDNPVDEKAPSMGAKTLCIPFKQPTENPLRPGVTKCFACDHKAKSYTLWGRSY